MASLLKYWKFALAMVVVFFVFNYLNNEIQEAKRMIQLENTVQKQEEYIDTRKDIDNAVKDVRGIDDTGALEWLRARGKGAE